MEAERRAGGADDADIFNSGAHPVAETLQRPHACELGGNDLQVRVAPAVVPRLRQLIGLAGFSGPDQHQSARSATSGSTFEAFRAGMTHAARAIAASVVATTR